MPIATYRYTARTARGESIAGSMQAADAAAVLELLRSRSLFATSVNRESDAARRLRDALRLGSIPHGALLAFFRSFVTLIRAGVSIARALEVTIDRASEPRLAEALRSVLADVENGSSVSDAMQRRPRDFPSLYVAMIAAGEAGGILDDVLERLALLLEREAALRRSVRTALAYPLIVLVTAGLLIGFLIVKIIPMFAEVFAGFHLDLPWSTQLLLAVGRTLAAPLPWLGLSAAAAAAALGISRFAATPAGALAIDRLRLRMPVVGPLLHLSIMARIARLLATLLRSGIELVAAMDAVVTVAGSPVYARAFELVTSELRAGEGFAATLDRANLFDPLFLALVRVGEEAGAVDEMLLKVAGYFEADLASAIATLGAIVEPILIIVLGGIVGFIVLSVFLPLYALIGGVAK
jgi:type IV pilus assembly protein PilC